MTARTEESRPGLEARGDGHEVGGGPANPPGRVHSDCFG